MEPAQEGEQQQDVRARRLRKSCPSRLTVAVGTKVGLPGSVRLACAQYITAGSVAGLSAVNAGAEEVVVLDAGQLFCLDVLCVAPRLGGGDVHVPVICSFGRCLSKVLQHLSVFVIQK